MKNIEKTITISIDNKEYKVSSLPEEIRNEIDKLDSYRQEHADIADRLEMVSHAILHKKLQITEVLHKVLNPPNTSNKEEREENE